MTTKSGLCPFAVQKIIPPGSNDPAITPRAVILHVAVSMAASLFAFFRWKSGGIESHFYVTWTGKIEQYRSIYDQADANLDANDFAIAIESAGLGSGTWNPLQLRAIKRLLKWLHGEAGIPLRKIDRWDGSGVGYHTMWGAPSHWTPVAKTCPGPNRIKQFAAVLVPWMATALRRPLRLGVATWNMGHASTVRVLADLAALSMHARIIGLQEAGDRSAPLRLFLATHRRWALYTGTIPGAPRMAILYRSPRIDRVTVLEAVSHVAVPSRRVVPVGVKKVGAGQAVVPPKVINHLHLRFESGEELHVLNTQFIASATRDDMSPAETRLRRQHYADHVAALLGVIASLGGAPFVLTGDFNAERTFGLLAPLAELVTGWTAEDTHDTRAIDHILRPAHSRVVGAAPSLPMDTSSDHAAVVATVTLKENR